MALVTIPLPTGTTLQALFFSPTAVASCPPVAAGSQRGLMVVHEWWGRTHTELRLAEEAAAAGLAVVVLVLLLDESGVAVGEPVGAPWREAARAGDDAGLLELVAAAAKGAGARMRAADVGPATCTYCGPHLHLCTLNDEGACPLTSVALLLRLQWDAVVGSIEAAVAWLRTASAGSCCTVAAAGVSFGAVGCLLTIGRGAVDGVAAISGQPDANETGGAAQHFDELLGRRPAGGGPGWAVPVQVHVAALDGIVGFSARGRAGREAGPVGGGRGGGAGRALPFAWFITNVLTTFQKSDSAFPSS